MGWDGMGWDGKGPSKLHVLVSYRRAGFIYITQRNETNSRSEDCVNCAIYLMSKIELYEVKIAPPRPIESVRQTHAPLSRVV